jgi:hypothetical protein
MSCGQQLMVAYHAYANDFRSNVMPGYASPEMTTSQAPGKLIVNDESGEPILGVVSRRYPWRMAPYLQYNFSGFYDDPKILDRYKTRSDYQYVVSLSPSLGINAEFVGGKGEPGLGFNPNAINAFGQFYVTRTDQVIDAAKLMVFSSARGVDPDGGVVNGFHMIDAPNLTAPRWSTSAFAETAAVADFGNVHPRHEGKAVSAHFDGHAMTRSIDDLRDMRVWSNRATKADWTLIPR